MEQRLLGRGAELPSASVLLHQLSQVGGVNDRGFELLRLEDLLSRHCSQPEVATACIAQYNSLMEGLGAETGIEGKPLPSDREAAMQHLRTDGSFVPFVVREVLPAHEQQQLVAAFTFEVKLPAGPTTTTVARLALWDVFTRAAYRRRHLYMDAHVAVALALVRNVRGLMCIELRCRDRPEVIAAHVQAGYSCTLGAGAAQEALPTEQLQLAKAVVQTMREAPGSGVYNRTAPPRGSEPTAAEARVLERIERELGGAASGGQDLEIRRAAVRTVLCPPPLLQPVTSEARSGWMVDVGVAEWVTRRADSWPRRAHELLCQYVLASADGPSLLSRGARGVALTLPRAVSNETPEWVSTCLRETLGLPYGARIPGDVAVLSAIDVAVAALVGSPPQDLQGDPGVQQGLLRAHLLDGRCRRGQGVYRRPCLLCETYPLVLAAMEQLVALATRHADCCLPAAVERPARPSADPHSDCIVNLTLRRKSIRAKTPQEPPLWAMCVRAPAAAARNGMQDAPMHPHAHAPCIVRAPFYSGRHCARRGDAGVATLRVVAGHLLEQLQPGAAGATLVRAPVLERLRACAAQAGPRNGDAEAAAAVMCARGERACRECHKHAGDPAKIGLPLLLTALEQQHKRPRVAVDAAPMDWTTLQAGKHGAEIDTGHLFNQLAIGLGGDVVQ